MVQLGPTASASPAGQTLQVQGVVGGTANTAGADFTIAGSQGTGTAMGGAIAFQVAPGGVTGGLLNPMSEAMRVNGNGNVGIGTTNPGAPLDVKGAIRMSGSTSGYAGFRPEAAAGSTVWTLPASDGTNNQVLTTNGSATLSWTTPSGGGGVTSVVAGTGLASGTITSAGTLNVNVGTGANQILQLNGSSQIPAVSGALLTNLNASNVSSGTLAIANGGTGLSTSPSAGQALIANGTGGWTLFGCTTTGQTLSWTVGTGFGCATPASGTVTNVTAGSGLTGGTITGAGTIALASSGVAAGTYGTSSAVPQLVIDAFGRVTSAGTVAVSGGGGLPAANGTASSPSINFTNSTGTGLFRAGTSILGISTAGSEVMRIDATGYVGVNATSPTAKVQIGSTDSTTQL